MSSSVTKASKMLSDKKRPNTFRKKGAQKRFKSKKKNSSPQEKKFRKMLNQRARQLAKSRKV